MLNMRPMQSVDSPLRRSGIGVIRTPVIVPAVNDDEAERWESREHASFLDSTTADTIADKEGLQNCLKFYNENKINKDNAWAMSLIDNFSSLISKHHKSLSNFQIVGTTLEASSKIYGLRVDSVYLDTMRMTSGLTNTNQAHGNDNDNDTGQANETQTGENEHRKQPAAKKPRVRKPRSTIAGNDETIAAKLDTYPFIDPFFVKLNTTVGNVSSSDRLMQNILSTEDFELLLKMDYPFLDHSDVEPVEYLNEHEWENSIALPMKLDDLSKHTFREQLNAYKIQNTPSEDDSKEDTLAIDKTLDQSHLDVAFDMDAEIEPITDVHFLDVDLENAELNELTEADQDALKACKGLRRNPIILQDLRPLDSSSTHLEYSYRPLDDISQFWAGPSYWKFKKFRTTRTTSTFPSNITAKKAKKKKGPEELLDEFDDSAFMPLTKKSTVKLRRSNIYKKWDVKALKLPTHLKLDSNIFLIHPLAPGLPISNTEPNATPDIETSGYNYNNADDKEYCSNIEHDNDEGSDRNTSNEIENACPNPSADLPNETVAEIGTIFEGAPQMVERIQVPYARKAKVVDMKQLKKSCLTLIDHFAKKSTTKTNNVLPSDEQSADEQYKDRAVTFNEIYAKLPATVTKDLKDALSPSVAFYAILHLANENQLRLMETSDNDFIIRQIIAE